MKIIKKLEKSLDFWFLLFSLVTFFFLRLPSLFEPDWYGDEGIYQTIGLALNRGALLYRDIWDNKPPLLYYLYASLGSDEFLLKLASLLTGLLATVGIYLLAKKLFVRPPLYILSTVLFSILFGLPLIEGNIANAENFMLPFIIFSALFLIHYTQQKKEKISLLAISGVLLGISFLFKIVSVFDFGAFFIFLFIFDFPQKFSFPNLKKEIVRKFVPLFVFTVSFIIPFVITLIYFAIHKAIGIYLDSMFFSNIGYVGSGNKFIIPQGLLILKMGILGIAVLLIFFKRNSFKFISLSFVLLWICFSMFNAFFSQRSYPHYLLVLLPSFCLFFGSISIYKKIEKYMAIFFIILLIIIWHFFSFYGKDFSYYKNFLSFAAGKKKVVAYQTFFDRKTPRDYEIANFINAEGEKSDGIFVWGDNAQLYKLTNKIPPGKYTVAYHILQYKDGISNTKNALLKNPPRYIILIPGEPNFPFSLYNYQVKMNIEGAIIYERVI